MPGDSRDPDVTPPSRAAQPSSMVGPHAALHCEVAGTALFGRSLPQLGVHVRVGPIYCVCSSSQNHVTGPWLRDEMQPRGQFVDHKTLSPQHRGLLCSNIWYQEAVVSSSYSSLSLYLYLSLSLSFLFLFPPHSSLSFFLSRFLSPSRFSGLFRQQRILS